MELQQRGAQDIDADAIAEMDERIGQFEIKRIKPGCINVDGEAQHAEQTPLSPDSAAQRGKSR